MTKVKSISIEGSSPTPIVDKGIDEAQTRSTVSVTDVVKVQDGNGIWHAIPFNKFMEVATPLVASIMNNVNLQGNIKKFLGLDANGNPGVSTIADAASVLGVGREPSPLPYTTYNDSADLNNQPASGTCAYLIVCYSGTANNPFSARSVFLHIQRGSMGSSGYCAMQIGCGDGKTAIKMRVHNGSSWQAWN